MTDIKHNLVIKVTPDIVYKAITTQQGIEAWWCKETTAKPEVGFVNVFVFGQSRNEMKVTELIPDKKVEWLCTESIEEWVGTAVSFELGEKSGATQLRFTHGGWRELTDMFAICNYNWALFLKSLKTYCETGTGTPS